MSHPARRRMELKFGTTRTVLLLGNHAYKFPGCFGAGGGWGHFLHGLLANMQEVRFSRTGWPELCPVIWRVPGGFLIVMRRADPLPRPDYDEFDFVSWCQRPDYLVPAEAKIDSFGLLNGHLVAVDYGS